MMSTVYWQKPVASQVTVKLSGEERSTRQGVHLPVGLADARAVHRHPEEPDGVQPTVDRDVLIRLRQQPEAAARWS